MLAKSGEAMPRYNNLSKNIVSGKLKGQEIPGLEMHKIKMIGVSVSILKPSKF